MEFPHYQLWVNILSQRDAGIMLIASMSLNSVIFLAVINFVTERAARRLLPALRIGIIAMFYVVMILSALGVKA
jgi:hypothetical protein